MQKTVKSDLRTIFLQFKNYWTLQVEINSFLILCMSDKVKHLLAGGQFIQH